jgi:Helicase conserved C-terminal domain
MVGDDDADPIERMIWTVQEMNLTGLLRGGLPTPVLRLLASDKPIWETVNSTALELFPASIQTFTVQADLTAIVPAELEPSVAAELEMLTDGVSRSTVSVMRFTEPALRHALDRGRTAAGIIEFLRAHAKPSVPQALEVMINDVARRHGRVRVGRAASYLRTEDEALLTEITRHRKLSKIALRVIAPTVAVSDILPPKLLAAVREAGFLPAVDGDGVEVKVAPISDRHLRVLTPSKDADRAWAEGMVAGDPSGSGTVTPSPVIKELAKRLKR